MPMIFKIKKIISRYQTPWRGRAHRSRSGISALSAFYSKYITRKCLTTKMAVTVMQYSIHIGAVRLANINLCKSHIMHFCAMALIVFEVLTCEIYCFWKCRSRSRRTAVATMQFDGEYQYLKRHWTQFLASSRRFRNINFRYCWSWKCRSMSRCTEFTMAAFIGKYV